MGITDIEGLGFLQNVDISGLLGGLGKILIYIFIFLIIATILGVILYNKHQKSLFKNKIHFFEEVNGQPVAIDDDIARELFITNTNISVFYCKNKKLWIPRPTKKMGKHSFWFFIKNNREIINFTLANINEEMAEAGLDYDHTDMRYGNTQLKEIIKRNYRDKSTPWWKEYKDLISVVVYIFVVSIALFFLIKEIGSIVDKLQPLIDRIVEALSVISKNCGSGVATG